MTVSIFILATESMGQMKWWTDSKTAPKCHILGNFICLHCLQKNLLISLQYKGS